MVQLFVFEKRICSKRTFNCCRAHEKRICSKRTFNCCRAHIRFVNFLVHIIGYSDTKSSSRIYLLYIMSSLGRKPIPLQTVQSFPGPLLLPRIFFIHSLNSTIFFNHSLLSGLDFLEYSCNLRPFFPFIV